MMYVTHRDLANSPEWRAIRHASMLDDALSTRIILDDTVNPLDIPIGSVEFCTMVASRQNTTMPAPLDYPTPLTPYLKRTIKQGSLIQGAGSFVKPIQTKLFDAFLSPVDFDEFYQLLVHKQLDPITPCWISDPRRFVHEWRIYIMQGKILGLSQYDLNEEDVSLNECDMKEVHEMIVTWKDAPIAYALDVGRTDEEELLLVEVNDGWATGYYPFGDMKPTAYAQWCAARWEEISK